MNELPNIQYIRDLTLDNAFEEKNADRLRKRLGKAIKKAALRGKDRVNISIWNYESARIMRIILHDELISEGYYMKERYDSVLSYSFVISWNPLLK